MDQPLASSTPACIGSKSSAVAFSWQLGHAGCAFVPRTLFFSLPIGNAAGTVKRQHSLNIASLVSHRSVLDVPPLRYLSAYDAALERMPMQEDSGVQVRAYFLERAHARAPWSAGGCILSHESVMIQ